MARLKEDGAVILNLSKNHQPQEFGWKALGDSPLSRITRNPWNLGHTPGGSSAGAAAACAAGIAPLHVGSDGAGSIRIPACFSGVFGIKATHSAGCARASALAEASRRMSARSPAAPATRR